MDPQPAADPYNVVCSPLLFLAFINYLPECTKYSTTRLFADNWVLYKRISSHQDAALLQEDLEALQKWEATWLMQFHPSKCQVVHVTNKCKPIAAAYNIHGMVLEEVPSAKYLGLHIVKKLTFNTHVAITCKKANSTRAFLQRNFSHCSHKIKEATYKTYVRPIAEYASIAWDPNTQRNIRKIEQIQRSSARYVTNNYDRRSSVTALLSKLEWPSLQVKMTAKQINRALQDSLWSRGHQLETSPHWINIIHQRS